MRLAGQGLDRAALQAVLDGIAARMARETERGRVARYIPELAKVSPDRFGLAVAPLDGPPLVAGDADEAFSIQSISKVFTLMLALDRVGAALWTRVGREPSGDPFNSIVQLEYEKGVPRNPLINAGAIVVADVLAEGRPVEIVVEEVVALCRRLSGSPEIRVDATVAASERQTGARNRALAQFMAAEGNMRSDVESALAVYFGHCSIAMSCRQLASAARVLAAGGIGPAGADPVVTPDRARRVAALMTLCGCYDASGEVAFRIGLPCKTGVGGGVLALVPGVAAVTAWSPGLDDKGNPLLGMRALEALVEATGWSLFRPVPPQGG